MTSNEKTTAYLVQGFYKVGMDTRTLDHFHICDEETETNYVEAVRAWHKAIPQRSFTWTQITKCQWVEL